MEGVLMAFDPLGKAGSADNPLPDARPTTGFASQPGEFQERMLNIHDLVVKHPHAVYFYRAASSAADADAVQIVNGDIVVLDRVEPILNGCLVAAVVDDELLVRRIVKQDGRWYLIAQDPSLAPILVPSSDAIFGVVTYILHPVSRLRTVGES
jgi:DNA polymerase V